MGSASSKLRKHLQAGDEVQALQLYRSNSELRKALDPNCSYGDSHQHETPLHLSARNGMQTLLGIFLFSKGGNPNKTNSRKETCLHCVCMETNSQSVHVCKRRAECLNYLLKWRGAKLAEGQVERIDLTAQDEKLNTALHYAAASGLSQCVEILIQVGAPLFLENEDSLTPCDTAERNGHASIALFLESKMVFSNDDELPAEEDNMSMPPVEEYTGLRPQDLQEAKDQLLVETADMLSVPLFTAEALLRNHEWSREMLLEAWMTDPVACCDKCGVTPPPSLFSEKPQVQENLASPVASSSANSLLPCGASLEAECDICADSFVLAEEPVHMTCSHRFCKDCWEKYLNLKIQEGDAHHITCPAYGCSMLVPVDIIEGIVSRDMALRYLQFDIKAFVDSNPDMKWCPAPGCGRAVKLPDIDGGGGGSEGAVGALARPLGFGGAGMGARRSKIPSDTSRGVDCGMGHYFCWECLEESHEPCSCENWTKWFQKIGEVKPETLDGTEQETELAANCLWLVTNSKACPNCKSPIQKNEGCNHMKCSKCKYDFCWVCLEPWKRHNTSTGGYFKCNRFEVVKKVEEQSAQMVTEAETKNKYIQELNRFVHYYSRFKNHENSYKLEEPLLKTAKDKMMKLAEAVTDNATANTETRFVEEAVQQLLKARRVLKCSYVYGFYLDGPGYKKIVFEFMQTELEECTEILSQMVNRLYLRTPRRRIVEQARAVQRKRLEFITAISKGLVPPETPPAVRKGKKKRRPSGETAEDEDLRKAILASIQEVDPANPWIKDASGRHTNVATLLEWPAEDSGDSDGEVETHEKRERIGKCHRAGCNKVRARNPKTNEIHDYCSMWCLLIAQEEENKEEGEGMSEIVLDEHMELLRALEMSRLQYLQDSGLLHVPRASQDMESPDPAAATVRHKQRQHLRPRSNSAGQQDGKAGRRNKNTIGDSSSSSNSNAADRDATGGISSMEELGLELQRFQELSSAFPTRANDQLDLMEAFTDAAGATPATLSGTSHLNLSSWLPPSPEPGLGKPSRRRDEVRSTIVPRVPNKSVEDLYCLDQPQASASASSSSSSSLLPAAGSVPSSVGSASKAVSSSSPLSSSTLAMAAGGSGSAAALTSEQGPATQSEAFADDDTSSSCLIPAGSDENLARPSFATAPSASPLKGGRASTPSVSSTSFKHGERVSTNNDDPASTLGLFGSMFGAIKDISVSNIHASESDKTKEFLTKDLASIFSGWDLEENEEAGKSSTASAGAGVSLSAGGLASSSEELSLWPLPPLHIAADGDSLDQKQLFTPAGGAYARRPLTLDTAGESVGSNPTGCASYGVKGHKSRLTQLVEDGKLFPDKNTSSSSTSSSKGKGKALSYSSSPRRDGGGGKNINVNWAEQRSREKYCLPADTAASDNINGSNTGAEGLGQKPSRSRKDRKKTWKLEAPAAVGDRHKDMQRFGSLSASDEKAADTEAADDVSLLQMAENLLQMTADVHSRMQEVEKGIQKFSEEERGEVPKRRSQDLNEKHGDKDGGRWRESSKKNARHGPGSQRLLGKEEKETRILFRLPKSAWPLEGYGSEGEEGPAASAKTLTDTSPWTGKSQKHSTSGCSCPPSSASARNLSSRKESGPEYDTVGSEPGSKGSRKKSSGKSSKRSKHKPQAVALMSDAAGDTHEVAVTINSSALEPSVSRSPKERARSGFLRSSRRDSDDLLYASPALHRSDHHKTVYAAREPASMRVADYAPSSEREAARTDTPHVSAYNTLSSTSQQPAPDSTSGAQDEYDDIDIESGFATSQGMDTLSPLPLFPSPPPPAPPSPSSQSNLNKPSGGPCAAAGLEKFSPVVKSQDLAQTGDGDLLSSASESPQNVIQYSLIRKIFSDDLKVMEFDNSDGNTSNVRSDCGQRDGFSGLEDESEGFIFQGEDCAGLAMDQGLDTSITSTITAASALIASDHYETAASDLENWEDASALPPPVNDERVGLIRGGVTRRSQDGAESGAEDGGSIYV